MILCLAIEAFVMSNKITTEFITTDTRGQDYKEKHKTRLKTNVKRTVLNNTKFSYVISEHRL